MLLLLLFITKNTPWSTAEEVLDQEVFQDSHESERNTLPHHNRINQVDDVLSLHLVRFDSLASTQVFFGHIARELPVLILFTQGLHVIRFPSTCILHELVVLALDIDHSGFCSIISPSSRRHFQFLSLRFSSLSQLFSLSFVVLL